MSLEKRKNSSLVLGKGRSCHHLILQFAINTSKASRLRRTPGTALPVRKAARVQAVTCLAQLALPHELGRTQGEAATALNLHTDFLKILNNKNFYKVFGFL